MYYILLALITVVAETVIGKSVMQVRLKGSSSESVLLTLRREIC